MVDVPKYLLNGVSHLSIIVDIHGPLSFYHSVYHLVNILGRHYRLIVLASASCCRKHQHITIAASPAMTMKDEGESSTENHSPSFAFISKPLT